MTRRRIAVLAAVAAVVVARSLVLVCWPQAHFDSDQAVTGLMAKHLAEGRAFPVFMYGQSYLLAVQAWMAAPVFLLFGVSVAALKFPLLIISIVVAVLLIVLIERETALHPALAAVAAVPFILPAPGTAALLLEATGGNLEPFLYVLLLWLLRGRPWRCGLLLGFGFLQREFTLYGFLALLCIWTAERTLFTRAGLVRAGRVVLAAAGVWIAAQGLRHFSSAAGPGTTVADLWGAPNNLVELVSRTCIAPVTILAGMGRLFSNHWPQLLGTAPYPLSDFTIESRVSQGFPWASVIPGAALALAIARLAMRWRATARMATSICAYLALVGLFSAGGYVAGRCGELSFYTARYELLSLLGIAGIGSGFLAVERSRPVRYVWLGLMLCWAAATAVPHAQLLAEYVTRPPLGPKQELVQALEARGLRYGYADFWVAYYVSFMANERVILASSDLVKIRTYNRIVDAHAGEAVRISRRACAGGEQLTPFFWSCRP
jgi:hypothetical protein